MRPSVSVRAEGRPGAPELMVSFRHKMGFLCQAGAMNSFGDAALLILQRTGARAPQSPPPSHSVPRPSALGSSLRQTADCPRVSLAYETPKLRGRLEGGRCSSAGSLLFTLLSLFCEIVLN